MPPAKRRVARATACDHPRTSPRQRFTLTVLDASLEPLPARCRTHIPSKDRLQRQFLGRDDHIPGSRWIFRAFCNLCQRIISLPPRRRVSKPPCFIVVFIVCRIRLRKIPHRFLVRVFVPRGIFFQPLLRPVCARSPRFLSPSARRSVGHLCRGGYLGRGIRGGWRSRSGERARRRRD